MRKERCGADSFGMFYVEQTGETHISKHMLFYCGKHHFWKQAFRLVHIHVFKFMRCFAMAKQHFQHANVNQKGSTGNQQPSRKPTTTKKTKISEPMDSHNHSDNPNKTRNPRF